MAAVSADSKYLRNIAAVAADTLPSERHKRDFVDRDCIAAGSKVAAVADTLPIGPASNLRSKRQIVLHKSKRSNLLCRRRLLLLIR